MSGEPRDRLPFRPYAPNTQPAYDSPQYWSTQKRHPKVPLVPIPHTVTRSDRAALLAGAVPDLRRHRQGERLRGEGRTHHRRRLHQ
jgi:hypothetical protein